MNYSKKGIRAKQKSLNAKSTKFGKKLLLAVTNLSLLCILAVGIIGISLGLGVFKGIIDTSPSIENVKVTPTGFSTFVYDLEGNQIAKLIWHTPLWQSRMNVFMSTTELISRVSCVLLM